MKKRKPILPKKQAVGIWDARKQPDQELIPQKIGRRELIAAMMRLSSNADYRLLLRRWVTLRGKILEVGKDKPSEGQWSVLKGFDVAVMEADFWAQKEINPEDLNRRSNELAAQLGA